MSLIKEQKNKEKNAFLSFFSELFKKRENKKEEEFKLGLNRFRKELSKRKKDFLKLFIATLFIFIPFTFVTFLNGKILDALINGGEKILFGYSFDIV